MIQHELAFNSIIDEVALNLCERLDSLHITFNGAFHVSDCNAVNLTKVIKFTKLFKLYKAQEHIYVESHCMTNVRPIVCKLCSVYKVYTLHGLSLTDLMFW